MEAVSVTFTQCFHRMLSLTYYRHNFLGLGTLLKGTMVMFHGLLLAGIKPTLWLNHYITPPPDVWRFNNHNVHFLLMFSKLYSEKR